MHGLGVAGNGERWREVEGGGEWWSRGYSQLGGSATLFVLAASLQTLSLAATVLEKSIDSIYHPVESDSAICVWFVIWQLAAGLLQARGAAHTTFIGYYCLFLCTGSLRR